MTDDPWAFFAELMPPEQVAFLVGFIGAAIAAAMGLVFVVLGIRKGLGWFFAIVEERITSNALDTATRAEIDRAAALYDKHVFDAETRRYGIADGDDDEIARFREWFDTYARYGDQGDNFEGRNVTAEQLERWRA